MSFSCRSTENGSRSHPSVHAQLLGRPKFARASLGTNSKRKSAHCSGYAAYCVQCRQETAHRRCCEFFHVHFSPYALHRPHEFQSTSKITKHTYRRETKWMYRLNYSSLKKSFNGQQQRQQLASSSNLTAAAGDVYRLVFLRPLQLRVYANVCGRLQLALPYR